MQATGRSATATAQAREAAQVAAEQKNAPSKVLRAKEAASRAAAAKADTRQTRRQIGDLDRHWRGHRRRTSGDLSGSTLSNYNRFLKRIPSGAEEPTITQLPDGSVQFGADVPARNIPGSYAPYIKVVDPEANAVTFFKTTYTPDGSVVHVKVKYP